MKAQHFTDLEAWQAAHRVVLEIYRASEAFPRDERFGLTSQLRRAAVSIPANIAEGFARRTRPDKARFYTVAQGSLEEVRYYLILARDLGFREAAAFPDLDRATRLLQGLVNATLRPPYPP
jgi:four helix bundle protein